MSGEITFRSVIIGNSPLLVYTVSYLSGILIGSKYTISPHFLLHFSACLSSFTFLIYFLCYKFKSSILELPLILFTIISFISLGWMNICSSSYSSFRISDSGLLGKSEAWVCCIIKDRPAKKLKITKIQVLVLDYDEGMILFIDNHFPCSDLQTGDTIFARVTPEKVINNANSRFDYSGYLEKKGIYSTSFIKSDEIRIHKLKVLSFNDKINKLREKYITKIISLTGSGDEAATLIALTIGETSYLEADLKKAYSSSGTMHLLAVSGLHVGFIYAFISYLLIFLGNYRSSKLLRLFIIVSSLWFFSAIAGFAPSITRAVIMATVYEICKITERKNIGLNTLLLSALIITIIDPQAFFDIGFQLSYVAVLSIILIHPKISKNYLPQNRIVKSIWATVSISIACQIGTSIITVKTFGFIPSYFLLSNFLAIPLSAIILYLAMGQLVFIENSGITAIITDVLSLMVKLLNGFITRIETLPYPTIPLSLNNGQIISIIMIIVVCTVDIIEDKTYRNYICFGLIINFIVCSL